MSVEYALAKNLKTKQQVHIGSQVDWQLLTIVVLMVADGPSFFGPHITEVYDHAAGNSYIVVSSSFHPAGTCLFASSSHFS